MRCCLIILFTFCFSLPSFAQTGVLIGQVTDSLGRPLRDVSVALEGTGQGTLTAPGGDFLLESPPGTYRLAVHAVGRKTAYLPVQVAGGDTTTLPPISITRTNHRLQEIVVADERSTYRTDKLSSSLKLMTPLDKVPQNIQVITAAALADRQVISLKDGLINNVSGATRLEHWDNYTRINMRGTRASEFRNGFNVTSDWGPLTADMSMVERIEFVKGPAGFMMANGEPGGMFNIVTKKPTGQTQGNVNLTFGSFDLYRGTLDLDGRLDRAGRLLYRLNLMGQTQNSFQQYKFDKRYTLHPVLTYRLDEKTELTLEYALQFARFSDLGSSYLFSAKGYGDLPRERSLVDPGLEPSDVRDQRVFVYLHHHFNKYWKLSVHAAYMHSGQSGSSVWPSTLDSAGHMIRNITIFDAINEDKFAQMFLNGRISSGPIQHSLLIGLDMGDKENTYDFDQSHELDTKAHPFNIYHPEYGAPVNGYPDFDRETPLNQRAGANKINQQYAGIYLQDELAFWQDKLRLTVAGRFTHVKQSSYGAQYSASRVTPRLGLSVSIDPTLSVYGLFDQSFLPQNGLLRGDRLPDPQTGDNYEIGIKKSWFNDHLQSTLAAYRIYKNGMLVSDPDTTGNADHRYSLQLGQARTEGIELDIRGTLSKGLKAIVNYAYTDSRVTKDIDKEKVGDPIPGFAKHLINGWLNYRLQGGDLKGLGISVGATYKSDRSTWTWASVNQMPLPDYFRMDAGLSYRFDHFKINLSVRNLLDAYLYEGAPYGDYYYWQMEAPRNFRMGIAYHF